MSLTGSQLAILKADILANPDANALYTVGDLGGLLALYNAASNPAFTVWKTNVPIKTVGDNLVATELAGLTSLNTQRLQCIADYSQAGINPSLADRRAFFDDVFSGAGGASTRAKLLILWKRIALRGERVFATGTGSDAVPGLLTFEGLIALTDLQALP